MWQQSGGDRVIMPLVWCQFRANTVTGNTQWEDPTPMPLQDGASCCLLVSQTAPALQAMCTASQPKREQWPL